MSAVPAFLRVPPFPRARATRIVEEAPGDYEESAEAVVAQLRACRVGGAFWDAQPVLPALSYWGLSLI